jgi:uncharacterized protein YjbI with pentapeptide repeats
VKHKRALDKIAAAQPIGRDVDKSQLLTVLRRSVHEWNELQDQNMYNEVLDLSNETGANLTSATFNGTRFIESACDDADFTHADLTSAVFADTSCCEATFKYADLTSAYFGSCDCTKAVFDHADLQIATFSHSKLTRSSLLK